MRLRRRDQSIRPKFVAAFAAVVLASAGAISISPREPVLFTYVEEGDPSGEPIFALMNPLRDRQPEQLAESLLRRLKASDMAAAPRMVRGLSPNVVQDLTTHELRYPIVGWRLVNRNDSPSEVSLVYRVARKPAESADEPVRMTVQRLPEGWQISGFEAWY